MFKSASNTICLVRICICNLVYDAYNFSPATRFGRAFNRMHDSCSILLLSIINIFFFLLALHSSVFDDA